MMVNDGQGNELGGSLSAERIKIVDLLTGLAMAGSGRRGRKGWERLFELCRNKLRYARFKVISIAV